MGEVKLNFTIGLITGIIGESDYMTKQYIYYRVGKEIRIESGTMEVINARVQELLFDETVSAIGQFPEEKLDEVLAILRENGGKVDIDN